MIPVGSPLAGVDGVLADLDGVVYASTAAIPHAADALQRVAAAGLTVGYVTNNAARTATQVAAQLRGFGLAAGAGDVVTSPQAAVDLLAERVAPGSLVLVVGGEGITEVLEAAGYRVTRSADDRPAAVVQGFHPSVGWADLAEAAFAIQRHGIPWIATNQDWTLPQARGIAPGNGTLVSAVHLAVGRLPEIAGKPEPPILRTAMRRFGVSHPLVVGDRLDTDIRGAVRVGVPSALVLTGIDGPPQLVAADETDRPTYILDDLRDLFEPYPMPRVVDGMVHVRGAVVALRDGSRIEILDDGGRFTDAVRAACAIVWGSGLAVYAFDLPDALRG